MELEGVALEGPAPAALPAPGVPVQAVCGPMPEQLKCQKQRAELRVAGRTSLKPPSAPKWDPKS
jgi:hypothetical protein